VTASGPAPGLEPRPPLRAATVLPGLPGAPPPVPALRPRPPPGGAVPGVPLAGAAAAGLSLPGRQDARVRRRPAHPARGPGSGDAAGPAPPAARDVRERHHRDGRLRAAGPAATPLPRR